MEEIKVLCKLDRQKQNKKYTGNWNLNVLYWLFVTLSLLHAGRLLNWEPCDNPGADRAHHRSVLGLLLCKTDPSSSSFTPPARTSSLSSWSFIEYVWCSVSSRWGDQGWLAVLLQCSKVQTRMGMKSKRRRVWWELEAAGRMTGRKAVRQGPGLRKFKILWGKNLWPQRGWKTSTDQENSPNRSSSSCISALLRDSFGSLGAQSLEIDHARVEQVPTEKMRHEFMQLTFWYCKKKKTPLKVIPQPKIVCVVMLSSIEQVPLLKGPLCQIENYLLVRNHQNNAYYRLILLHLMSYIFSSSLLQIHIQGYYKRKHDCILISGY